MPNIKGYIFLVVLMVFTSAQAMACLESDDKKEERFRQYDANKDGYVDKEEWGKMKPGEDFAEMLKYRDKDNDKKLSKEEFFAIDFTRSLCL